MHRLDKILEGVEEECLVFTRLRKGVHLVGGWFTEPSLSSLKALRKLKADWAREAERRILAELVRRSPSRFLLYLLGD